MFFSIGWQVIDNTSCPWHLLGVGNIGTLAACYLQRAGMDVRVVSRQPGPRQEILCFPDASTTHLRLNCVTRADIIAPVQRLLVACKTPFTATAMHGITLANDAIVLRLQNGMGSLDDLLRQQPRLIEMVTTNAVMQDAAGQRQIVAENQTWIGPGLPDDEYDALSRAWPGLQQVDDIQTRQWHKLVANAVINPLTALFDVPNGALLDRPELRIRMQPLVDEADQLFKMLDSRWPGNSLARVEAIARATAANTSSMRADVHNSQRTEIDAINGWLIRAGAAHGVQMRAHRQITAELAQRVKR